MNLRKPSPSFVKFSALCAACCAILALAPAAGRALDPAARADSSGNDFAGFEQRVPSMVKGVPVALDENSLKADKIPKLLASGEVLEGYRDEKPEKPDYKTDVSLGYYSTLNAKADAEGRIRLRIAYLASPGYLKNADRDSFEKTGPKSYAVPTLFAANLAPTRYAFDGQTLTLSKLDPGTPYLIHLALARGNDAHTGIAQGRPETAAAHCTDYVGGCAIMLKAQANPELEPEPAGPLRQAIAALASVPPWIPLAFPLFAYCWLAAGRQASRKALAAFAPALAAKIPADCKPKTYKGL